MANAAGDHGLGALTQLTSLSLTLPDHVPGSSDLSPAVVAPYICPNVRLNTTIPHSAPGAARMLMRCRLASHSSSEPPCVTQVWVCPLVHCAVQCGDVHEEDLEELIFAGTDWQDDSHVGAGLGALGGLRELTIDFQVRLRGGGGV